MMTEWSNVKRELQPVERPEVGTRPARPGEGTDIPSQVVLYNDDVHTFDEVIHQLVKAIGCSPLRGYLHALEVHTKGRSVVFAGPLIECLRVAGILREIGLIVEVMPK